MRYKTERNIMISKLGFLGVCFCNFALAGCVNQKSYLETECEDGICTSEQEYQEVCTETPEGFSVCEDTQETSNVNYTRTQAQFREYGERTPRDYRITQAAAGNNMTATIPPSIDDEVVDYEAELVAREGTTAESSIADMTQSGGNRNAAFIQQTMQENSSSAPVSAATAAAVANTDGGQKTAQNTDSEEEDQNKDWLAEEGQSLKELLTNWSEESGWRLIWKTNRNYTLNAGAMFRGNFADVSSALVRAFARARPAPVATFYKGNRVLVIETMEDENAYD